MVLLDTHAFYWYITGDSRLPSELRDLIEENEEVYISIVSFWEMAIKCSLGKLRLPAAISELMDYCTEISVSILQINGEHLNLLQNLPYIHRDPFDRIIICQALAEGMTVLTKDGNIHKYNVKAQWT